MVKATYRTIQDYVQGCDEEYRAAYRTYFQYAESWCRMQRRKSAGDCQHFCIMGIWCRWGSARAISASIRGMMLFVNFRRSLLPINVLKTAIHLPLHEKLPLALIRRILIFCKEYNETHD